jgi:hypothetical protein
MFLNQPKEATREYLAHRGAVLEQGKWEELVPEDFQKLREQGRDHPLMVEIEKLLRPAPVDEAAK